MRLADVRLNRGRVGFLQGARKVLAGCRIPAPLLVPGSILQHQTHRAAGNPALLILFPCSTFWFLLYHQQKHPPSPGDWKAAQRLIRSEPASQVQPKVFRSWAGKGAGVSLMLHRADTLIVIVCMNICERVRWCRSVVFGYVHFIDRTYKASILHRCWVSRVSAHGVTTCRSRRVEGHRQVGGYEERCHRRPLRASWAAL